MTRLPALLLGALSSGLLLACALPPLDLQPLAWIALAPLLVVVRGQGLLRGFVGAAVAAAVASELILRLSAEGPASDAAWVRLSLGFYGFILAVVCIVAAEVGGPPLRRVLGLGALAVLLEALLMALLPPHFALTQYRNAAMVSLSSFTGIWGVSMLLWVVNLALAEAWHAADRRAFARLAILVLAIQIPSFLAVGADSGPLTRVAAIQSPAVDLETLSLLNRRAGAAGASLAVWPEFSALAIAPAGDTTALRALALEPGQPAFITTFTDGHEPLPRNASALFSPEGESDRYFKRKPFGAEKSMHTAGTEPASARFGQGAIGLTVCFDSCFPWIAREAALMPGVGLLAVPTIDPDSPGSFMAATHAGFSPFRASELGVPVVRADAHAFSHVVDRRGVIVAQLGRGGEGIAVADVVAEPRWTFYRVAGDWFLVACAVIALAAAWPGRRRSRPETTSANEVPRAGEVAGVP
jgi:apolipoprotein N-acyltransferase